MQYSVPPASVIDCSVLLLAGYETPVLATVACRVTAMTSSAGACERNWSSYDFIHCKKRNKLTPKRANDLVFVFTNLRLVQKFKEPEKFAEWVTEIDEADLKAMMQEGEEILVQDDDLDKEMQEEVACDSDSGGESD